MPEPLVCRNKALHVASPGSVWRQRSARQHHLQHVEKLFRHFQIALIAGMMEGNQDFVREPATVARCRGRTRALTNDFCFRLTHNIPQAPFCSVSFG
jgi:hypothetical protein